MLFFVIEAKPKLAPNYYRSHYDRSHYFIYKVLPHIRESSEFSYHNIVQPNSTTSKAAQVANHLLAIRDGHIMKFFRFFALSQSFSIASARLKLGARARATEQANQVTDNSNHDSPLDNNRIIGGKEAVARKFSYVVSLADDIGHFCGGSLIAPDVVLTAAHCQGGSYDIIVGRQDLSDEHVGEVIPVRKSPDCMANRQLVLCPTVSNISSSLIFSSATHICRWTSRCRTRNMTI